MALLSLAGCQSEGKTKEKPPVVRAEEVSEPYCSTVGNEVPPAEVLGKTYDKAEQLKPTTKLGQAATGIQWLWSILGSQLK
jgi:hypothetical protein